MLKLQCQCCDIIQEFPDADAAFWAGWDAPPHFSYVGCDLCPGVCVALGASHKLAHAIWAKEGRPKEFTVAKCGTDETIRKLN